MEFRDALKALRKELGITQVELATALHISGMTISRWELGKTYPNRAMLSLLLGYAYTHSARKESVDLLKKTVAEATKHKLQGGSSAGAIAIEHSSLVDFINTAPFPIYVCDIHSDSMLYANNKALEMISNLAFDIAKYRCFECLMHRETPCGSCDKSALSQDEFSHIEVKRKTDNTAYTNHGKLIRWNGHEAQIRCVFPAAL